MRAIAVLNKDAGTLRTMDLKAYADLLEKAFTAKGHDVVCHIVAGREVVAALEEAAADPQMDALIIAGGDGSVSSAAAIAWKTGHPLGVIPAGTMNLFARAIGLPLDVNAVPSILAKWNVIDADIGDANGNPFVHQFSAGMHARMIRLREKIAYKSRLGKIAANIRSSIGVLLDPPGFDVTYKINGKEESLKVSAISVSNNAFGPSPMLISERLDGGHLGLYLAKRLNWRGAFHLAFDLFRGKLKDNIAVHSELVQEVELHFPRRTPTARCVLDGELMPLPRDIRIRIHPGALKVLGLEQVKSNGAN
ncbi:diacylglycerol/lipid kinase family protein [Rhizobium sp. C4]|uniref:diacylglycerol/lipid kinase family protein n=1 Tax=Rhizobium sp. C4 TaxID=1349800 RepID=UPI001E427871|nr:diacylglycerol kinase family protein [Rhizobium sp. C4]MCD2174097.1 diacylglycerol kinase family lipid kinase [Rhizobium sp. C4]